MPRVGRGRGRYLSLRDRGKGRGLGSKGGGGPRGVYAQTLEYHFHYSLDANRRGCGCLVSAKSDKYLLTISLRSMTTALNLLSVAR